MIELDTYRQTLAKIRESIAEVGGALNIETMKEHFATFATARVMLSSVTYEEAKEVYDVITEVEGVTMVDFNNYLP